MKIRFFDFKADTKLDYLEYDINIRPSDEMEFTLKMLKYFEMLYDELWLKPSIH